MKAFLKIIDILFSPITVLSALWLKFIRKYIVGLWHSKSNLSRIIFNKIGLFPIIDHYYEPLFNMERLKYSLRKDRILPGIDLNVSEQLALLEEFSYNNELMEITKKPDHELVFSFKKGPFKSGDAEYLYNIIRLKKPKRIIEVGSGHSTLMAQHAIQENIKEKESNHCQHICIEPFENPWLEKLPIEIKRELVEEMKLEFFEQLDENDILFIDSSHIIDPKVMFFLNI